MQFDRLRSISSENIQSNSKSKISIVCWIVLTSRRYYEHEHRVLPWIRQFHSYLLACSVSLAILPRLSSRNIYNSGEAILYFIFDLKYLLLEMFNVNSMTDSGGMFYSTALIIHSWGRIKKKKHLNAPYGQCRLLFTSKSCTPIDKKVGVKGISFQEEWKSSENRASASNHPVSVFFFGI